MSNADKWKYYKAALEADAVGAPLPTIHADKPQFGFYYAKANRSGGKIPAVVFEDSNGDLVIRLGTREQHSILDATERWTWVADRPVTREAYVTAWETGTWPDGSPTRSPDAAPAATPGAGHNLPADPFERLKAEVEDRREQAQALLDGAASRTAVKVDADKARNLQAELLRLKKEADGMHEAEKAPHLEAGRAVDKKFEFRKAIDDVSKQLRTFYSNIVARLEAEANEAARREHQRKLQEAEAERQRLIAEREKLREDDPIAALTSDEPELPDLPPEPEPVKINVGGGVGRAAGLKDSYEPDIVDYEACVNHFRHHRDVRAVVEKLVKAQVKIDKDRTSIPGVVVRKGRVAA